MKNCYVHDCGRKSSTKIGLCLMHHRRLKNNGDVNVTRRRLNGHGSIEKDGYVLIHDMGKQRREHIVIAEKAIGKPLPDGAVVHHVDCDPGNNEPTNLVVCPDQAYHFLLHKRQRAFDACGHADWRKCPFCKKYDDPKKMSIGSNDSRYHMSCKVEYNRSRRNP